MRTVTALCFVLAFACAAAAQPLTPEARTQVLEKIGQTLGRRAYVTGVDFLKWDKVREENATALDRADSVQTFTRAANRCLRSFGVSHLRLIAPKAPDRGEPRPQPPAGNSSRVILGASARPLAVRETLAWLDDKTAVLKVTSFDEGAYDRRNLEQLMTQAAKAEVLILDLCNNGGGEVGHMNHLLGMFLPAGTKIGTYVSRDMSRRHARTTGKDKADAPTIAAWTTSHYSVSRNPIPVFKGKVAVLINRGTASASEIIAAALRDYANAPLVGSRSAGQVLLSNQFDLAEGFKIQIPLSDYVTLRGVKLEGNPLTPHWVVTGPRPFADSDAAARQAAALLREGI